MKTNLEHTNSPNSDWKKLDELNSKLTVRWEESSDEIWKRMETQIQQPVRPTKVIFLKRAAYQWAAAAVVLLLLGTTAFMRFYTQSYEIPAGQHQLVELPDHSKVQLNAGSEIAYHPYWWSFSREVKFEGEAYFEVQKRSRFEVQSANGSTSVLGTSFNIYSRDEAYRVTCLTGKVQVSNPEESSGVVLLPDEKAEWVNDKFVKTKVESKQAIAWTTNSFVFTASPVREVFDEIERQYNVRIDLAAGIEISYSGNFDKEPDVKQVLKYVCRPLSLNFTEEEPGLFRITKSN